MRIRNNAEQIDGGVLCERCFAIELGISRSEASRLVTLLRQALRIVLPQRCVGCGAHLTWTDADVATGIGA